MSTLRHRLRSDLTNLVETKKILNKIKGLLAQSPHHVVLAKGTFRANALNLNDVILDETLAHNNIQFQRPPLEGGAEATKITLVADTGHKASASLATTAPIVLTSALMGASRNTNTFHTVVNAAAANPTDTVLAVFTGTAAAIVLTITPNDGTNNSTTPVNLTTAQVAELINTGAVAGKSVTVTDGSSLRAKQTASGGGATALAHSGEGDALTATFTLGVNSNLNSKYFKIYAASDASKYYVWYDINGEGVDPAPAGFTSVHITGAAGASAHTLAVATAAALDGLAAFVSGIPAAAVIIVVNAAAGPATDTVDGAAPTGFTISKYSELESYDISDIQIIKRLRTKKWMIRIKPSANPAKI